jgi:hypothetical protein
MDYDDIFRSPKWYIVILDIAIILIAVTFWVAICLYVSDIIHHNEGNIIERNPNQSSRPSFLAVHPYTRQVEV